jgi:hypothetical protein
MKNLFDITHYTVVDTGSSLQLSMKFIHQTEVDLFHKRVPLTISKTSYSLKDIADIIKSVMTDARAVMPVDQHAMIIEGLCRKSPMLIWIGVMQVEEVHDLQIDILSHYDAVEFMANTIDQSFDKEKMAMVKWWHRGRHGDDTRNVYLPPVERYRILPEFYPDLGDPSKYLAEYMESEEAILLIAGPPGTGKTTLIRHLISKYKLCAHVIYDELMMEKDSVFQSFLFDEKGDVMVIEDADTILQPREHDGNKLMSRFLNVSDGLIKLPNKKLIFTTNLMDFTKVDQALLRPGRCFGVMHTRPLNLTEAQAAARVANLPVPTEKREWTLAELFNQGKQINVRTIGFGVRH